VKRRRFELREETSYRTASGSDRIEQFPRNTIVLPSVRSDPVATARGSVTRRKDRRVLLKFSTREPVICFLASDAASFLAGETIEINGGMLME